LNFFKGKILKSKKQIEKAIEKQRLAAKRSIERQREKQREKQNCPEYRQEQFEKQKASQERANNRRREKEQSPEFKKKQLEKQKAQQEATIAKSKAKPAKPKKINVLKKTPLKSKGLTGRSRKTWEIELHNQMAAIGCICCLNEGLIVEGDSHVSIHHTKGRTSPDAHEYCLPLCTYHHDQVLPKEIQSKYPQVFPIHAKGSIGGKVKWEKVNGTQLELVKQVWKIIEYKPEDYSGDT
jgi:hypothetical protein